ncbi:hypothetical protein I350_06687 [Cryptococcus amylolentus CBS 6273]|uniref:Uncharacterized protein n=1 Tax=Cryptococcus amylolentus CBS 6273 TaxID=1296118 RepID=A0A1E3JGU4_9TREE|nr:hypothetical protein I350_06687 [Cryptococcus amylolentus CBS 6273]
MSNALPFNPPGAQISQSLRPRPHPTILQPPRAPSQQYLSFYSSTAPEATDALPDRMQANDPETNSCVTLVVPVPSSTRSKIAHEEPPLPPHLLRDPDQYYPGAVLRLSPKNWDACLQHSGLLETIPEQVKPFALRAFLTNSRHP